MALDLSDVRIYIEEETHPIYDKLVSQSDKKAEYQPFRTMKDLFVIAACVGAQHNIYKPTESKREIFRGNIFRYQTDVPILAALAYQQEQDVDVLTDPRKVGDIAQGWANGGILVLQDELLYQAGNPLGNWVNMLLSK
jgi:dnd system-associated protein 4